MWHGRTMSNWSAILEIVELPFNAFIGLETCSSDDTRILCLPDRKEYTNHVGTVHASALFALAEASSGRYLQHEISSKSESMFAVLRTSEIKYRKPAKGKIYSTGRIDEDAQNKCLKALENRGKGIFTVEIDLRNETDTLVATARFNWFLSVEK